MPENNITSNVEKYYKDLKRQRDIYNENYVNTVYERLPIIKEIDKEISFLALKCATMVIKEGISADEALRIMNDKRDELNRQKSNIIKNSDIPPFEELPYKCSLCQDTGLIGSEICRCYKELVRKYMIEHSKKISHFSCDIQNDTFDNFKFDYYGNEIIQKLGVSPKENIKRIFAYCKKYCENFGPGSPNLFFNGSSGLGKTYMSNCIANALLAEGISVVYQSAARMFTFLEDYKFGNVDRDEYNEFYNSIFDCDLLIIDDLGTEFSTAYTNSVFFDLLNTRLLNNKKTIISTNTSMRDIEKKYTERVSSRIIGDYTILYFVGEDIRKIKRCN